MPKNNVKLRVYINLKKANATTIRDNFPLPISNHLIERVAGAKAYNFLDGFSGYNQISIDPKDQHKIAFALEQGTSTYKLMPFGLTNAPATFQRPMCHIFREFLQQFLDVYVDDQYCVCIQRIE